ncbi:hypothetical protein EW145_g6186 [Phellinidium pouzarii]|uniref:Protein kinase domain-containing protein n=1 Tax=Phellinidium pouzarii TaxID=167371 RepID=A0A4S4KXY9_9AGAM|nr:hypothetical protein EW145_g6186 [Phellinidium pouzarii]
MYEERQFRILVMRKYYPIHELTSYDEFWDVLVQIATSVHKIYAKAKILHRDISIGNLAFYRVGDKVIGILLDFDLASFPHEGHASRHRTGTAPFMAREVLNAARNAYCHGIHHELESILYIAIWHGVGYVGYAPPNKDILKGWRTGDWSQLLKEKKAFLDDEDVWEPIMSNLKSHDKNLAARCLSIRRLFVRAYKEKTAVEDVQKERSAAEAIEKVRKGLDPFADQEKPTIVTERAITFSEWMKAAGEELHEDVKSVGLTLDPLDC